MSDPKPVPRPSPPPPINEGLERQDRGIKIYNVNPAPMTPKPAPPPAPPKPPK